jgi:RNA polymerase sigma-70 factor (ECF subfamily)
MALRAGASDEELVGRVARGDAEALSLLYDRHRGVVFGLALRILRDRAEAEEVLTDVFFQAWRSAAGFEPLRGSVAGWLVTLCRSRAIDRLRARGRRGSAAETLMQQETFPPAAIASPEQAVFLEERRRRVADALGHLTPEQRTALELAYYGGHSHAEIAEKLGAPLGTVKTRIRQGLLALRERLISGGAEER